MLWISGDTVLYDGVRNVADWLDVDIALLHLGGVRFPVTGPVRYSMTGRSRAHRPTSAAASAGCLSASGSSSPPERDERPTVA